LDGIQTLSSVKVPMSTSYAIGILRGNQLHLNPVQAVVQFRPSMKYIDDHDAIHKKSNKDAGITDGEDEEMVDAEPVDSKSELTLVQCAWSVCWEIRLIFVDERQSAKKRLDCSLMPT